MPVEYNISYNSLVLFIYVGVCRMMTCTISIHCMIFIVMKILATNYHYRTPVLGQLYMLQNGQGISLLAWCHVLFWYLTYSLFIMEVT